LKKTLLTIFLFSVAAGALAIERFPPPDFGAGYAYPHSVQGAPRLGWLAWLDVSMLLATLTLASVFVFKLRSRRAMAWLSLFSLAYFGFYRKGCICPIGAIQNVAQGIFDPTYLVPLGAIIFFTLPLLFALAFGRVFCGGVCPLGALQDAVLIKAHKVPAWLASGLSVLRYIYLGLGVMLAATGSTYVICKYDPFVEFFRMAGLGQIWLWSGFFLLLSMFIGRPYCRFLCPYGALLGIFARFAYRKVSITPDRCLVCHLCREQCPYGCIREAQRQAEPEEAVK
jgi:polyferredoxin